MDATDETRVPSTTPLARPRRVGWPERHAAYCMRAKDGDIDLLFIGDSLTQRWETAPEVWQKYFGHRKAAQMGIDNDYTQQVLWRITHGCIDGISPKLVVLLIGLNNIAGDEATPEETVAGIQAIVEILKSKLPRATILLMSMPLGDREPDWNPTIRQTNALIQELATGDGGIRYIDLTLALLGKGGKVDRAIQPDGVHFSPAGYEIWARWIEPVVSELLGNAGNVVDKIT